MSEQRVLLVQRSVIGTCALVAVVLLASFYMVVSGAVERGAARQRLASVDPVTRMTTSAITHHGAGQGAALLARVGN